MFNRDYTESFTNMDFDFDRRKGKMYRILDIIRDYYVTRRSEFDLESPMLECDISEDFKIVDIVATLEYDMYIYTLIVNEDESDFLTIVKIIETINEFFNLKPMLTKESKPESKERYTDLEKSLLQAVNSLAKLSSELYGGK